MVATIRARLVNGEAFKSFWSPKNNSEDVNPRGLLTSNNEDVTLYIEDIPELFRSLRAKDCVTTRLIYKELDFEFEKVTLYWFIRFLYIYYCAHGENSFRYRLDGKFLDEVDFVKGNPAKKFDFLLTTESNTKSSNFPELLRKTIENILKPLPPSDKDAKMIYKLVHHERESSNGFKELTLNNLKIVFFHKAHEKMKKLEIRRNSDILELLDDQWQDFLKMIKPVISCKDINSND